MEYDYFEHTYNIYIQRSINKWQPNNNNRANKTSFKIRLQIFIEIKSYSHCEPGFMCVYKKCVDGRAASGVSPRLRDK